MIKIPLNFFLGAGALDSEDPSNIPTNLELTDSELFDEEISLDSLSDVEWVTNAIEPDQQRGPSENP